MTTKKRATRKIKKGSNYYLYATLFILFTGILLFTLFPFQNQTLLSRAQETIQQTFTCPTQEGKQTIQMFPCTVDKLLYLAPSGSPSQFCVGGPCPTKDPHAPPPSPTPTPTAAPTPTSVPSTPTTIPTATPVPPVASTGGIEYPPTMTEHPAHPGYFLMPESPDGSYRFESFTCQEQRYGSKLLVGVLYTVSKRWRQLHPQGRMNIGDLNASGHQSHKWGRAVDLDATTNGIDWVADFTAGNYNRPATIELGKLFVDTDSILHIWYNDQEVNNAVLDYAQQTGKSQGMQMNPIPLHDNHFHVDVNLEPLLSVWEPSC